MGNLNEFSALAADGEEWAVGGAEARYGRGRQTESPAVRDGGKTSIESLCLLSL